MLTELHDHCTGNVGKWNYDIAIPIDIFLIYIHFFYADKSVMLLSNVPYSCSLPINISFSILYHHSW